MVRHSDPETRAKRSSTPSQPFTIHMNGTDTRKMEITEYDESGNLTTTYVESRVSQQQAGGSRVDVILPERTKSYWQQLLDVFLPAGYPQSVTEDYLECVVFPGN